MGPDSPLSWRGMKQQYGASPYLMRKMSGMQRCKVGRAAFGGLLALLTIFAAEPALAQEGSVGGTVLDETGAPVSAAQVQIVGTNRGTLTDARGRYVVTGVPVGPRGVEARRIGFQNAEVEVVVGAGAMAQADLILRASPLALEAVVVTGQGGEISRRRLSTNVDVISSEQIEASPATRLDQLLQASLPSAQIRMTSGQAGTSSIIRTRGINSVSTNSTPVIYVDGVRVDNLNTAAALSLSISGGSHQGAATSAIADLPMDNIDRIEHIPGGAATTLYGSDAANGVIQIFTKKGSAGPTRFTVESQLGMDTPVDDFHFFDRTRDLLYRNGLSQQYSLGIQGGSPGFTYSVSGNVRAQESHRREGENNALGFRTGFGAAVGDRGRYTASLSYNQSEAPRFRNGNAGGYNSLWFVEGGRSFAFGFDNNIDTLDDSEWNRLQNFVHHAEALQNYRVRVRRFITSHGFTFEPTQNLTLRSTLGLDQRLSNERAITTNEFLIHTQSAPEGTADRGSIQNYDRNFLGLTAELGAQHRADVGGLSFVSSFGGQLFRNSDEQVGYAAQNVRDGSETLVGAGLTSSSDFTARVANYGLYGQTNIGFRDRYFVEVGLRADRNTAFGQTVGTQFYPKLGVSYDVTSEPWLRERVSESALSQLRLRANYGQAGNFPRPFANDRTVAFNSLRGDQAATFGQPGNPDLSPERTSTIEVGAEASMFDDRASFGITWYNALTRDALLNAPSAPSTGEATQLRNVGEIENSGIELRASVVPIVTDDVRLTLQGSFNTLNNMMKSTGGTPVFNLGGMSERTIQAVVEEGYPVGYLRGPMALFNPDGTLDRVVPLSYLGKPHPDYFGSMSATLRLGSRVTLNADGDYQFGAQSHSFDRQFRFLNGLPGDDVPPAAIEEAGSRAAIWGDLYNLFVEDTDYVKLRSVTLDYSLPERFLPGLVRDGRIGFSVTNVLGWATSTFDPEIDLSGGMTQGAAAVGGFNYSTDSLPRTFLVTIGLGF